MENTVITIDMDAVSLRAALTRLIEQITMTPPDSANLSDAERVEYNMALYALFSCLRQTF
ncbi:MAG: hypothetical protein JJO71_10250 [Escherichia coli]|nr:hypothetical protein [Escherichia coli]MBL0989740.1 hypothetical protein [Escherichia coli]MBL0999227.1 hypothetical protein [Escherichia coli]MBL1004035.1 hypothetical protein [Escherichia coli]